MKISVEEVNRLDPAEKRTGKMDTKIENFTQNTAWIVMLKSCRIDFKSPG